MLQHNAKKHEKNRVEVRFKTNLAINVKAFRGPNPAIHANISGQLQLNEHILTKGCRFLT